MPTRFRPNGLDHNLFWSPGQEAKIRELDVRRGLGKIAGSALPPEPVARSGGWRRPSKCTATFFTTLSRSGS